MNRCLKDQTLLLLHDGEGTGAERHHLTECEACATRYRQLGSDLEAICQVLREEPPPQTVSHRFRPATVRWLPTAVAATLAFVLVWQGVRMWTPSAPPTPTGTTSEEISGLAEGFSADLFLPNQALAEELGIATAESYDLAAALEAERPCEWYDMAERREVESFDGGFGAGMSLPPSCVELNPGQKKRSLNPKT